MFCIFKLGRYVIEYVSCICHVSLNVHIKAKKTKRKEKNDKKNSLHRELGPSVLDPTATRSPNMQERGELVILHLQLHDFELSPTLLL